MLEGAKMPTDCFKYRINFAGGLGLISWFFMLSTKVSTSN